VEVIRSSVKLFTTSAGILSGFSRSVNVFCMFFVQNKVCERVLRRKTDMVECAWFLAQNGIFCHVWTLWKET